MWAALLRILGVKVEDFNRDEAARLFSQRWSRDDGGRIVVVTAGGAVVTIQETQDAAES